MKLAIPGLLNLTNQAGSTFSPRFREKRLKPGLVAWNWSRAPQCKARDVQRSAPNRFPEGPFQ